MSKAITKASTKQKSKSFKIPSDFFQNKKIINTIFSFLPKKTIVRFISTSSKLQKEYDIKIDDYFVPRKFQEKIKNYNYNYEDLFYQVLNDMKKEKEKNSEKFILYEFENDIVKYLKYLTEKFNKMIKISLINVNDMEIWKLDFISKLLQNLEKNIHLRLTLNYRELKSSEIFTYILPFSKAVNVLEIVDIFCNRSDSIVDDIISLFNFENIQKIIINIDDYIKNDGYETIRTERFLINFLNEIKVPNLVEFDLRCNFITFNDIEKFLEKNGKNIKKLTIKNYQFKNDAEIDKNLILNKFEKIDEFSLIIFEKNLEKIFYFFYPIFPKIKNFHLIINENIIEDELSDNDDKEKKNVKNNKNKNKDKKKKRNKTKDKKSDKIKFNLNHINYFSEIPNFEFQIDQISDDKDDNDDFTNSKNINLKKISFTTEKREIKRVYKNKVNNNISYVSTLSNLNKCESLTYEIKLDNIYTNDDENINSLSYLINVLEVNKNHLKYLEIYLNNNFNEPIDINDFTLLIEKISNCINLRSLIFECELFNDYALVFNTHFYIGQNLSNLSLIHSPELDIMKIINFHKNLVNIRLELISSGAETSKDCFRTYNFNLCSDRDWKSIELTNYPINQSLVNLLKENQNISSSFYSCINVTDSNN